MERAVEDGKLKSIGLSNYYTLEDFDRLVEATTIVPVLLQNETHPYHQSMEMKEHLKKYDTVIESWFSLGGRGNTQTLFNDETIVSIAEAHKKTSAQIILRWHLQAGLFVEDAVLTSYQGEQKISEQHGREEIEAGCAAFLAFFDTVYHMNGQQVVHVDGNHTKGKSYCQVVLIGKNEEGKRVRNMQGV